MDETKKPELKEIKVKSVSGALRKQKTKNDKLIKNHNRFLWATVAAMYPQYTLQQASELSLRDINLLIRVKKRKNAEQMLTLCDVFAKPYMNKSQQSKLTAYLEEEMNS